MCLWLFNLYAYSKVNFSLAGNYQLLSTLTVSAVGGGKGSSSSQENKYVTIFICNHFE